MAAAVAGGVTSLVCPPDTDPALDEPGLVEMLQVPRRASCNQARVYPLGALTRGLQGETLTEMAELTEAGCVGFSQAEVPLADTQVLQRALQYAATFGYTVWLRPQDACARRSGVAHERRARDAPRACPACRSLAETIALHTIFELVRATGARVHLCRLSAARPASSWCAAPRREGLPVTCDVEHQHAAPDRHRHRLLRRRDAPDAAAAPAARPRRARARRWPTARSTRCVATTRRSTTTRRRCRSPRPSPAPPALELLLGWRCKWGEERGVGLAALAGA